MPRATATQTGTARRNHAQPPPTQPPVQPGTLTAATAATAAAGVAHPPPVAPTAAAAGAAAKPILAALKRLFATRSQNLNDDLLLLLHQEHPDIGEDYLKEIVRDELRLEGVFQRRSRARAEAGVKAAMLEEDAQARREALQKVLDAERRYAKLREESLLRRMTGRVEMLRLKLESPRGAYWKLDPGVREHTLDCLVMGEKWWPWEVLERINPANRHHGCACRLVGFDDAERLGWITEDLIPDPKDAMARARRYAEDVPEIKAALRNDKGVLEEASVRGVLDVRGILPDMPEFRLRWPKGWSFGGRFRPQRGGTPGTRVLHGNVPHRPEPPTVSRDKRRGRHVPIDGRVTFIPEQEDFKKTVGKREFTSPKGGTNVYRNGKLVSEPGRRGKHPDVRRKALRSPPIAPATLQPDARQDAREQIIFDPLKARVINRARALDPDESPIEVGDPAAAISALGPAGFKTLGDSYVPLRVLNPETGAVLEVELGERGEVAHVEWLPDGIPFEEGLAAETTPGDIETFQRDLLAWSEELADEYGANRMTRDVAVTEGYEDHSGRHDWDGMIHLGVDVPGSLDAVGKAMAENRGLTPSEARDAYFTYRLGAHEMAHGINWMDVATFDDDFHALLEEALAEEVSTPLSVDRLKEHGNEETLRWLAANVGRDPATDGNYLGNRAVLENMLVEAQVPPELWEDVIFDLKFRIAPEERPAVLTMMVADAHDISYDEAEARIRARNEATTEDTIQDQRPLLAADLDGYEPPPRTGILAPGDSVSWDGGRGEVVDAGVDELIVLSDEGVAVVPRDQAERMPPTIEHEGEELGVGDLIHYGDSEARITRVMRSGSDWDIEATTTNNSAKPDQPVRLTPERAVNAYAPSLKTPVELVDEWHRQRDGDHFEVGEMASPGISTPPDKETVDNVTDDVMQGIEAFGPVDWEENYQGNPEHPLHGGETWEGWQKFIADNADMDTQERADAAQVELRADPRWRRVEERWGRNAVIGHAGQYFLHDTFFDHPDASRFGGVTYVFPKGAMRPRETATGPRPGGGSVEMGLPAVLRHEYGHSLWKKLDYAEQGEFLRHAPMLPGGDSPAEIDYQRVATDLSPYPQETYHRSEELFTETFALAFDPRYNPDDFAPWVREAVGWIQDKFDPEGAQDREAGMRRANRALRSPPQGSQLRSQLEAQERLRVETLGRFGRSGVLRPQGYESVADFVLREGNGYDAPDNLLPSKYEEFRGPKKQCFRNAAQLVTANPELTYVEGYGMPDVAPIPLAHAWAVTEDGTVIDPTWDGAHEYWGVSVPTDLLQRWVLQTGKWGLFGDWENHYPELAQPWSKTLVHGPPGMRSPGLASPPPGSRRVEVGGTPYRPGDEGDVLDAKLADYGRRWSEAASRLGISFDSVPQEGFWGGDPEPSVATRSEADPAQVVAAAALIGQHFDQDAMAVFTYDDDGPGGRFGVRIPESTDRAQLNELIAGAMPEGQGASVAGDEAYFYAADAAEGEQWAEGLAEALDSDWVEDRGTFTLISDASYGDRTYDDAIDASPEARALAEEWADAEGRSSGARSEGGEGRGFPETAPGLNSPGVANGRRAVLAARLRDMEPGDVVVGDLPGVRVVKNPEREQKPGTIDLLGRSSGGYTAQGMGNFGMPLVGDPGEEEDMAAAMTVPEGIPDAEGTLGDPPVGIAFFQGFQDRGATALVNRIEYDPTRYGANTIKYHGAFFVPEAEGQGAATALGQFEITFTQNEDGSWTAYHDWIHSFQQGTGLGTNFHNWLRDNYPEMGVKRVHFRAAKTGSYVWAKAGYGFRGYDETPEGRRAGRRAASGLLWPSWHDFLFDLEEVRGEGKVTDEELGGFLSRFAGAPDRFMDGDELIDWSESQEGMDAWTEETDPLEGIGEHFATPQEIAMWGIENPWTEVINGKEVKMWIGKKFLLQTGSEWDAEHVYE